MRIEIIYTNDNRIRMNNLSQALVIEAENENVWGFYLWGSLMQRSHWANMEILSAKLIAQLF